jgi:hypothetical protein
MGFVGSALYVRPMTRLLCALAIVFALGARAQAQPGMVPPAYAYQPQLSDDDRELLDRGELDRVSGGVVSILIGFGVGQAVQGRWHETGWIFTAGETVSMAVLITGIMKATLPDGPHCRMVPCDAAPMNGTIIAGFIGYSAFHIWEIIDAFAAPAIHNRRLHALQTRLAITPYVTLQGDATTGGLALRF